MFPFRQLLPDALPHFQPILVAADGRLRLGDQRKRAGDLAVERRAHGAVPEMTLDRRAPWSVAVVIQRQLVVGAMRHSWLLRSGSSATRSFFTARKTLCLAALVPRP